MSACRTDEETGTPGQGVEALFMDGQGGRLDGFFAVLPEHGLAASRVAVIVASAEG